MQDKSDSMPLVELMDQAEQYQDASLAELLDLLDEAAEPYAALGDSLPPTLRRSARQEITFFAQLLLDRLTQRDVSITLT